MGLTPKQQLQAQITGTITQMFVLIFVAGMFLSKGFWYVSISVLLGDFLLFISYIGAKQKYDGMLRLEQEMQGEPEMAQEIKELLEDKNNGTRLDK